MRELLLGRYKRHSSKQYCYALSKRCNWPELNQTHKLLSNLSWRRLKLIFIFFSLRKSG